MSSSARHLRGKSQDRNIVNLANPKRYKYAKLHKYAKWSGIIY